MNSACIIYVYISNKLQFCLSRQNNVYVVYCPRFSVIRAPLCPPIPADNRQYTVMTSYSFKHFRKPVLTNVRGLQLDMSVSDACAGQASADSWDSVTSGTIGLDDWGIVVQFSAGETDLFFVQTVQIGAETHPPVQRATGTVLVGLI